jgi:exoribonuclease-2
LERYWTLRYLKQEGMTELDAAVMANGLVRADTLPLVFKATGCDNLPRHAKVRVRITGIDELTLDVHASLVARLEATEADDANEEVDEGEEAAAAAPLSLAIDVNEADAPDATGASAPC